ncbi:CBS domain-containing protein [Candidatus Parabeggiatoa sp. HSG14]|uniref:CBS domain-containing protein n=1 Tax=Candidatus Parabeggiatoa sp. HSG14 TaxID=3055593 RepID=UPI0025A6CCD2|nr:CBS domain-containing protein [Thiotrichales bacterium HSG14]
MIVKEIMTRAVKSITPETRLQEVASLMCLNRFSGLPVVEDDDKLIGVVAERDVLSYLFPTLKDIMEGTGGLDFESMEADYKKILPLKTTDLMTRKVIAVRSDMAILKAASIMARNNFRRIPVADDGKLVGIISLGDIHRAIFIKSFSD